MKNFIESFFLNSYVVTPIEKIEMYKARTILELSGAVRCATTSNEKTAPCLTPV